MCQDRGWAPRKTTRQIGGEKQTMKKRILALALALCLVFSLGVTASAADGGEPTQETVNVTTESSNVTISDPTKLVVSGDVTLTGTGDAFTINANTELVFEEGASLTLTGYDNAFVVENATLSGGGWVINDGDGMDLFRLQTGGKLNITGDVDLNGYNKATASRAIVLASGSGQEVTLADNSTLAANNFYRGVETGGASDYTIKGSSMTASEFDFSDNDCGMYLSYFDSDAHFEDCTLEVSNCPTSGIFMRQDNASLNGLYIDHVNINCVNDLDLEQADIAVRFHTVQFAITNSVINIENAWNTGLWICDGWEKGLTKEISNTEITVKHVEDTSVGLYGPAVTRKAITLVPFGKWTIDGCTIVMEGTNDDSLEGGLNIASDIKVSRNGFNFTAKPSVYGGTIKLQNSEIYTDHIDGADVGAQIGQFIEIGPNVVIDNNRNSDDWVEHFTVLCDDVANEYAVDVLGITLKISYDDSDMSETEKSPNRIKVSGGSYWSTRNENLTYAGVTGGDLYATSVPVNEAGEDLTMFTVTSSAYNTYVEDDVINLIDCNGESYEYKAVTASDRDPDNRYIWAPTATVTFTSTDGSKTTVTVPRGPAFGLTQTLDAGNWVTSDGTAFTASTTVTADIEVTEQ